MLYSPAKKFKCVAQLKKNLFDFGQSQNVEHDFYFCLDENENLGKLEECRALFVDPIACIDSGRERPTARVGPRGEWAPLLGGFIIFGGASEAEQCDPECYILRCSGKGWSWSVLEATGDESMPAPGSALESTPHAPWGERGTDKDTGSRVGHQFTLYANFMVLTGGYSTEMQQDIYVLDLHKMMWSKPKVSSRCLDGGGKIPHGTDGTGRPTARTGHVCAGFQHGLVLFGGFDGACLNDVHHLCFMSGPGVLLTTPKGDIGFQVAKILSETHAESCGEISIGDFLVEVDNIPITSNADHNFIQSMLAGKQKSLVSLRFKRVSGTYVTFYETQLRRGDRLHQSDGYWIWEQPQVDSNCTSHESWLWNKGVSGSNSGSAPCPRYDHCACSFENSVIVFGGYDGHEFMNDIYILETLKNIDCSDGKTVPDFKTSWKWHVPPIDGELPETRSCATISMVGRRAVLIGGGRGSVHLPSVYVLDCDSWTWSGLLVTGMISISQHLSAAYQNIQLHEKYKNITELQVPSMTTDELAHFLRFYNVNTASLKTRKELIGLVRLTISKPGILLFGGIQDPMEPWEKKGNKSRTFRLELPKRRESEIRPRILQLEASGDSDVFVAGKNQHSYLGLGIGYQPMVDSKGDVGEELELDSNASICARLSHLSTKQFDWEDRATAEEGMIQTSQSVCEIACGPQHAVARCRNGQIFSWGVNEFGQLGLGDDRQRQFPERISYFPKSSNEIIRVACGREFTLAVTSMDELFSWGSNRFGQLGLGHSMGRNSPQRIPSIRGKGIAAIACGWHHSLVLTSKLGIFAFGCNDQRQLGTESKQCSNVPVPLPISLEVGFLEVSAGAVHSAAVSKQGELFTWGGGTRGQLGHGRFEGCPSPKAVALPGNDSDGAPTRLATSVCCGHYFTAVVARRRIPDTEQDTNHPLGRRVPPSLPEATEPMGDGSIPEAVGRGPIPGPPILEAAESVGRGPVPEAVERGSIPAPPKAEDAEAFMPPWATDVLAFGSNGDGELGVGSNQDCAAPVVLRGLAGKGAARVSCGRGHALCVCDDGAVYAWGRNRCGQLGLGHRRPAWAPQMVVLEQGGRPLGVTNYPWVAPPGAPEEAHGFRGPNPRCRVRACAGDDGSFFVCLRRDLTRSEGGD